MIMKSSVPAKISLKILNTQDAIEYLNGEDNGKKEFILVKTPQALVALTDAGIKLDFVNVGGIGAKAGRKTLYKNISTSEAENKDLIKQVRTPPERTMSGVVRGLAESSVPVDRLSWRGNPAGMNCCGDRLHSLECASVLSS